MIFVPVLKGVVVATVVIGVVVVPAVVTGVVVSTVVTEVVDVSPVVTGVVVYTLVTGVVVVSAVVTGVVVSTVVTGVVVVAAVVAGVVVVGAVFTANVHRLWILSSSKYVEIGNQFDHSFINNSSVNRSYLDLEFGITLVGTV